MLHVDEFESVFRGADKRRFRLDVPQIVRVLVVRDEAGEATESYAEALRVFLGASVETAEWHERVVKDGGGVEELLAAVGDVDPDLLCTYRNLASDAWKWSYSLGAYLNALTRGTTVPVVVTPSPHGDPMHGWKHRHTDAVMVVTDHLTGDDRLVNWGVALVDPGGTLHLTHVEHGEVFERYMAVIGKIPDIDTEAARELIQGQLLREPHEYIETCAVAVTEANLDVSVRGHVVMGRGVPVYRTLLEEQAVDLLVFPTLEEGRIALHGIAYSLAVELVDTPLLLV